MLAVLLARRERDPARADGEPRHKRDIEGLTNRWFDLGVTAARSEGGAAFHRAQQNGVKAAHGVGATLRQNLCTGGTAAMVSAAATENAEIFRTDAEDLVGCFTRAPPYRSPAAS